MSPQRSSRIGGSASKPPRPHEIGSVVGKKRVTPEPFTNFDAGERRRHPPNSQPVSTSPSRCFLRCEEPLDASAEMDAFKVARTEGAALLGSPPKGSRVQTVLLEKLDVQDVRAGPSEAVMPPGLNPTWNPIRPLPELRALWLVVVKH